ncbi:hypothetical protein PHMEG_0003088 [Phytophthora megakarya]|uniref:Uncharacterized protein n=1 Tax=Phytophthora megakarya TaxID=4795 RepID=A0A225WYZ5_9STRA|nr:hypothetical protein PHMEG_0003088 [Phytophthora megakarya]
MPTNAQLQAETDRLNQTMAVRARVPIYLLKFTGKGVFHKSRGWLWTTLPRGFREHVLQHLEASNYQSVRRGKLGRLKQTADIEPYNGKYSALISCVEMMRQNIVADETSAIARPVPANSTSVRQLLDVGVIGPLKRHYKEAEEMLQGSKNMDRIVRSMTKFPLTWTKAILKDLVAGGSQTLDLAGIHLWNRISAEESMDDDDNIRTFHERVSNLSLPMGNSRDEYTSYLKDAFNSLSEAQQKQWNLLRWLSIFELITLSMCPAIFTQRAWLNYLVEHAGEGLPHTAVKLLSDQDLLQLLRSTVGEMILKTANKVAPGSALIAGLEALRSSPLTSTDLPVLTTNLLTPPQTASAMEAEPST